MPPCKYVEVCQLDGNHPHDGGDFCFLHLPTQKGAPAFAEALATLPEHCDFRWVHFPEGSVDFSGRTFQCVADFRGAHISGMLTLTGADLRQGFKASGGFIGTINLNEAKIEGPVEIDSNVALNVIQLERATCEKSVTILRPPTGNELRAFRAMFRGTLSIGARGPISVDLHEAHLLGPVIIRGAIDHPMTVNLTDAHVHSLLDLRGGQFREPFSFRGATFYDGAEIDLSSSFIHDKLTFGRPSTPPREVRLDGATMTKDVILEADLGQRQPRVVARNQVPRFEAAVRLKNADMSQCLLVGNAVDRMEFSNVQWARLGRRWALYDEVARGTGRNILANGTKEACQILKQWYQQMGDHQLAGDFHYGEMEIRRKAIGWPKQLVSPELWYWFSSGYGSRWLRALCLLTILLLGSTVVFWQSDPRFFHESFLEAFGFSLKVAMLQRPTFPDPFTRPGLTVALVETILGPVQIALLILALRMRVKR